MDLKDIIAIRGKGDLYRVLAKTPKGLVVESLNEKKSKFKVQPDLHVLLLSDITIFSNDNSELYLQDVFMKMFEKEGLDISVDPKDDPVDLRKYFIDIVPNHDEERVYASDMKKMIKWFNIIKEYFPEVLENLKEEKEEETSEQEEESVKSDEKKKTTQSEKVSEEKKETKAKTKKQSPAKK